VVQRVSEDFLYEKKGPIAYFTYNRPHKRNAMNKVVYDGLREAALDFDRDPNLRVAILSGAGETFCSGKDTTYLSPEYEYRNTYVALRELKKPLIAAIDGYALGAAFHIALFYADIRVATPRAIMGEARHRSNRTPTPTAKAMPWTHYMNLSDALYFTLTVQQLDGKEAHRLHLVNELVEPDQLLARATAIAERIATFEPTMVTAYKKLIRMQMEVPGGFIPKLQNLIFPEREEVDGGEG
jgi:enoyl-CoA hydratase/carnithine racemase